MFMTDEIAEIESVVSPQSGVQALEELRSSGALDALFAKIDACRAEAFSYGNQAGVGSAEWKVLVEVDEISNALPVDRGERFDDEGAVDDRVVERWLGVWAEFSGQQVCRFGHDHCCGDQWPRRGFE